MVLTGNPGTGKTTFARLLFRFLRAYGVLKKDTFVECTALELKAKYVGQTAHNVRATVKDALGGCLFLDEAYALAGDGHADAFSNEAIRTLLTEVENHRTGLLVVLAGYKDKMVGLMQADPGMPRRFPQSLHLPDYTPTQVAQISSAVASSRFSMHFEAGLELRLARALSDPCRAAEISKQNGYGTPPSLSHPHTLPSLAHLQHQGLRAALVCAAALRWSVWLCPQGRVYSFVHLAIHDSLYTDHVCYVFEPHLRPATRNCATTTTTTTTTTATATATATFATGVHFMHTCGCAAAWPSTSRSSPWGGWWHA
jgi:hypothetical protein